MTFRLAALHRDGWELESGVARHQASPKTFRIPSQIERTSVEPGQAVKLLFLIEPEAPGAEANVECERMWVLVSESASGHYRGYLDSEPVAACKLTAGLELYFLPEHIVDIGDPPREYYEKRVRHFTRKQA